MKNTITLANTEFTVVKFEVINGNKCYFVAECLTEEIAETLAIKEGAMCYFNDNCIVL